MATNSRSTPGARSKLLGHSTIATTANVYAGVLDSLKVDATDRLTRLMARYRI